MKIAICEDMLPEALSLQKKITEFLPAGCIADTIDIFSSGEELLSSDIYYDLLFIDCRLTDMSGIELAGRIRENNTTSVIIFVTSFLEYAADGYSVDALRYLLKPVDNNKLAEALLAFEKHSNREKTVEVTDTRTPIYAKPSEIMYIESLGRYSLIRLKDQSVNSAKSLDVFEKELQSDMMFRTSRQFIVNMKYIGRKEKDFLVMDNGEIVMISRRRLSEFNERYAYFLKNTD